MAACSRELLPKKGTGNSVIWNWFGFDAADKTQTKPCCKICFKAVATGSSSTTNLFQHLRNKHPEEWEKCNRLRSENGSSSTPAKKQTTLPESFTNCVPYDKNGARWKAITEAIMFYIATDMLPIYSVEKRGFNHMLKVLDARYVVPSRKYFADVALPHLYNTTREKIRSELEEMQVYSATTDLWSSRTMQTYLSLMVHYINTNWTLRSICLQTAYFPDNHTGEIIAHGLKDALSSWGLSEERLVCMTTDSSTNIIKALKDNNWPSLQCFGHRLHNAIENGVKDPRIDRAIGVCKKAVSAFSYSWKKRRDMTEHQHNRIDVDTLRALTESKGPSILKDYEASGMLSETSRKLLIKIGVSAMVEQSGLYPCNDEKQMLAESVVTLFPSLKIKMEEENEGFVTQQLKIV
ncbi:zinc finger BED domain-containing 1-like protein [Labeo rohita]|uniref:Zinc finger BED domain-containing 1-like protein n=1 Tax=Labeo rohita TaxID=84645 RepID=A0A498MKU7_LABRO|nr:zinc finger BED domain-containing 1-like protein [Labeo rohita]